MTSVRVKLSVFAAVKTIFVGMPSLLILWLAMFALACSEDSSEAPEMTLHFDSASQTLAVDFDEDDSRVAMDCSGYLKAYRTENGHRGALIGSDFDSADIELGYMLDGVLIPPIISMGCDVWTCHPLEGERTNLGLTEYHLDGTHTLTEAEKTAFDEALPEPFTSSVDEVNVYTTSTYSGVVEVALTYYMTDQCHDDNADTKTEVQQISVE